MADINVLDKEIFNLIAAGEVVEKPASAVKELIENSIDSGATSICIEINSGGIERIKVTDNGCGMTKENLQKAFLPHATSKIKTKEDLEKIGTLGFRGEALSSISAVSKVTAISKVKENTQGNKIEIWGGENKSISEIGCTDGTTMIIEDLFFNVPARAKFLGKPKKEESEITNYISRLIMANPQIEIKYISDGKTIFHSPGTNLYDAIYSIYGKSIIDNLIDINFENGYYKVSGYIGKPNFSKPNRTYQTLIINGRYVINQSISAAIYKAYENFLMKGNFPFFVINLNIPLDKVDVNVHPNKLDVKFEESNHIFGLFLNAVSEVLLNTRITKKIDSESNSNEFEDVDQNKLLKLNKGEGINFSSNTNNFDLLKNLKETANKNIIIEDKLRDIDNKIINTDKNNNKSNVLYQQKFNENLNNLSNLFYSDKESDGIYTLKQDNNLTFDFVKNITEKELNSIENNKIIQESIIDDSTLNNFKLVGTLFNTYILIEQNNKLLLIDQHAGHERILFDKFMNQINQTQVNTQQLLVPFILNLNSSEFNFIESNIESIKSLGFDIDYFGDNSFKISSVPVLLQDINFNTFFNNLLKNIDSKIILTKKQIEYDYIAKCACKAAIKGNDILSNDEISILIESLNKTQTLLCPHGRPIIVEITKTQIEKWFKRIV